LIDILHVDMEQKNLKTSGRYATYSEMHYTGTSISDNLFLDREQKIRVRMQKHLSPMPERATGGGKQKLAEDKIRAFSRVYKALQPHGLKEE